jgi:glycosyltransferase involved in cell wall biosynthesis
VAGDAALLVDPYNVKSIQSAMETIIESPETRQMMRNRGIEWADQFDWSKTSLMHFDVFDRIRQGQR